MRITMEDVVYKRKTYVLTVAEKGLLFVAENQGQSFNIAYGDIRDFQVTDSRGKPRFTMQTGGVMFEGRIIDSKDIPEFTSALKEKFNGFINIEVRKY